MSTATKDLYRILGVIDEAELVIIKAAYRALVMIYHPDRFEGDQADAVRRTKEINAAYAVLADGDKRKHYDASRKKHPTAPPQADSRALSLAIEEARLNCVAHYEAKLTEIYQQNAQALRELNEKISHSEALLTNKCAQLSQSQLALAEEKKETARLQQAAGLFSQELEALLSGL